MANEKVVNFIAEFDGTGAPTGTCWRDGVKYTFTASGAPASFRIPPSTGKTTDKITLAVQAFITYQAEDGSAVAFVIKHHGSGAILASWSSTSHQ